MIHHLHFLFRFALYLGLLALPSARVFAQYMFIDANGDGINTAADLMAPNGSPRTIDVWLDKNHNRDGSATTCNTGDGDLSSWNGWAMHANVLGGTASFSNYVNQTPFTTGGTTGNAGFQSSFTEMAASQVGLYRYDYGPIKLFTVTVTGLTGSPSLAVVRQNSLDNNFTCFGTPCSGLDFDNTYKLGTDWFDAEGIGPACAGCSGAPFLNAVSDMTVYEGNPATQTLTATDPDGSPVTFHKVSGPLYMTVTTTSPTTGAINVTAGYSDAPANTQASVNCTDGINLSQTRSFWITVVNVNRWPVVITGGPYSGVPNVPIQFDASASYDPDGDPLTFFWTFGDGGSASGPTPAHTYAASGVYSAAVNVTDGLGYETVGVVVTVSDVFQARAFTAKANRLLRLHSGKPYWTIQIEPVGGSFDAGQVSAGTITMKSAGTGSVSQIGVVLGKNTTLGDADGNGVTDIGATFAKSDLQALFSNLSGSTTATVTLEGNITSGGFFRAQADIGIQAGGGSAVAVLPNPLHRSGEVSFTVEKPGRVRVALFDVHGRLVRTLDDRVVTGMGPYVTTIDGRAGNGAPLASGIYYVRVATDGSVVTRRVTILK